MDKLWENKSVLGNLLGRNKKRRSQCFRRYLVYFCDKMHICLYISLILPEWRTSAGTRTNVRWHAADKRATGKFDHWCHLSSLPVSLSLSGETRVCEARRWPTSPPSSSGCTEMYISYPRKTRDNISLQRQISLQIKIPSIMSGRIQSDKSQRQTAAWRTGKHWQSHHITIHLYMVILLSQWLISRF